MKDEKLNFEEKEKYYKEKKLIIEERITLLRELIPNDSAPSLLINSYKLEVLELEASVEGIEDYWKFYTERLESIKKNEEALTLECETNYDSYKNILISITPKNLEQYHSKTQDQYNKLKSILSRENEFSQSDKNVFYSLVKGLLIQMKKIPS